MGDHDRPKEISKIVIPHDTTIQSAISTRSGASQADLSGSKIRAIGDLRWIAILDIMAEVQVSQARHDQDSGFCYFQS